jgi:acetyltransferase-like isoleucine patch superfamily enzyme
MKMKNILKRLQLMLLKKASTDRKVKYLRKQGMKIGDNCRLNTMSFSTEPYLIEIGNHEAIAGGSEIITHDGAGSVVRGKFPENSVIIGNPAKIVMKTSVQRFLYTQTPCLLRTMNIPDDEKAKIIKKHFGIV